MPSPAFTETTQIGIVVRDLDAKVQAYSERYGIGPWQYWELKDQEMTENGQPVRISVKVATAKIGGVFWELVQPMNDVGLAARWLAEKGEGVYHIAVMAPQYKEVMAMHDRFPLHATVSGIEVAYLPTEDELGVMVEVFDPVAFGNAG